MGMTDLVEGVGGLTPKKSHWGCLVVVANGENQTEAFVNNVILLLLDKACLADTIILQIPAVVG